MLSCSIFDTLRDHLGPEIAADDVAAERQRQAAGPLRPPLAEVDDLCKPFVLVRQLALVDQQPGLRLAVEHRLLNLIERHDDELEIRLVDPQRQVGGGQRAGNRDAAALHAVARAPPSCRRRTTIGPYLSPMLAPCGSSAYLSTRCAYA